MESIQYIIGKMTDSYLLPSIVATLIVFIYFSYKRVGTSFVKKPFTIFNVFYVGGNLKNDLESSTAVTEPNFPVTLLYPMTPSEAVLTQLRDKTMLHKILPKKKVVVPKHRRGKQLKTENLYINSLYKVWNNLEGTKISPKTINENETFWDYYNMTFPLNSYNENGFKKEHTVDIEPFKKNMNKNAVKNPDAPEITLKDKLEIKSANYYCIFYDDEEDNKEVLDDYCGEIYEKQAEPNPKNGIYSEVLKSKDSPIFKAKTSDGYELPTEELKLNISSKKSIKSERMLMDLEKDACNTVDYERYYHIA